MRTKSRFYKDQALKKASAARASRKQEERGGGDEKVGR